jgi:hypothetical protein
MNEDNVIAGSGSPELTPTCPLCGSHNFVDYRQRKSVRCSGCKSLERGRFLGLVLKQLAPVPNGASVVHFAPETGISGFLRQMYGDSYVPADIEPSAYAWLEQPVRRIDLCRPSAFLDEESVLGLVHCHVLEHVPADLTTTLIEMNAAIQPGGFHAFCVPFLGKYYSEDANPDTSREEREARYGQWDHMRAFGTSDFLERIRFAFEGFRLVDLKDFFTVRDLQMANIPARSLASLTSHTVFFFQKHK